MGLTLVCTTLLELAVGRSILRHFGVESKPEKDLRRLQAESASKWSEEKAGLEKDFANEKLQSQKTRGSSEILWRNQKGDLEKKFKEEEQAMRNLFQDFLTSWENDLIDAKQAEANLRNALAESQRRPLVTPISLALGHPYHVLPPNTNAVIDLLIPSEWGKRDLRNQQSIEVQLGNAKAGTLKYDVGTGTVNLINSVQTLPQWLWAGAVLKVTDNKTNSTQYFQLAVPRSITFPSDKSVATLNVFAELKDDAKNWPELHNLPSVVMRQ